MTITISELQKKIGILKKIKEPIVIIDGRSKKELAIIEPIENSDEKTLEKILSYPKRVDKEYNFEEIYEKHLKEKYGLDWC